RRHYNNFTGHEASGSSLSRLDASRIEGPLEQTFSHFVKDSARGKKWVDKTPGSATIESISTILRLFPSAKFIYMIRNGMDNVRSRAHKFPNTDFKTHCQQWNENSLLWIR